MFPTRIRPLFVRLAAGLGVVLGMGLAGPAAAQFGNPAGVMPGTKEAQPGVPAPGQTNAQDRLFIQLVGAGNAFELATARLADSRASSAAVKRFAGMMAQDHGGMGRKLAEVARPLNVPVPAEPAPDDKALQQRLEGERGAPFDVAYLQSQQVAHQKTALLLQWEISNGQEASVQAFAKASLPAVLEHLRQVQQLLAETTGTGLQGLAATQPPSQGARP